MVLLLSCLNSVAILVVVDDVAKWLPVALIKHEIAHFECELTSRLCS